MGSTGPSNTESETANYAQRRARCQKFNRLATGEEEKHIGRKGDHQHTGKIKRVQLSTNRIRPREERRSHMGGEDLCIVLK